VEKALELDLAGHPGQGHVEGVVPFSVIAGEGDQELFVRVVNMSWSPGSWVLAASGELLEAPVELDVSIEGSTAEEFATQVVGLPLVADPRPGEYRVELELRGVFDSSTAVDVPVIAWSEEERANLLEAARSGELGVEQVVADQVIRVLAPEDDPPGGEGTLSPGVSGGEGTLSPGVSGSGAAAAITSGPAASASGGSGSAGPPGAVWVVAAGGLLALAAGGTLSLRRRKGRSRE
jgi:hypothetical protein